MDTLGLLPPSLMLKFVSSRGLEFKGRPALSYDSPVNSATKIPPDLLTLLGEIK